MKGSRCGGTHLKSQPFGDRSSSMIRNDITSMLAWTIGTSSQIKKKKKRERKKERKESCMLFVQYPSTYHLIKLSLIVTIRELTLSNLMKFLILCACVHRPVPVVLCSFALYRFMDLLWWSGCRTSLYHFVFYFKRF